MDMTCHAFLPHQHLWIDRELKITEVLQTGQTDHETKLVGGGSATTFNRCKSTFGDGNDGNDLP